MLPWRSFLPTRRWLQFRLRTLFLLATALCLYLAWPHLSRQYAIRRLRGYGEIHRYDFIRHESRKKSGDVLLLDSHQVERLLTGLVPGRDHFSEVHVGCSDVFFVSSVDCGRARLLVIQLPGRRTTPGDNPIRMMLFDGLGRMIADQDILTGSRMMPISVRYEALSRSFPYVDLKCQSESPVIWTNQSAPFDYGSHVQHRYVAIQAERFAWVRVSDEFGGALQGAKPMTEYYELGPDHRFSNHSAWSVALGSTDEIDILEALLHLPPREAIERRDPADIARLTELSRSPDPWILEGATTALVEFSPPN